MHQGYLAMPLFSLRLLPLLFMLTSVTACGTLAASGGHRNATEFGIENQGSHPSDASITASIRRQLIKDTRISANQIDVRTSQGVVTVRGSVQSEEIARRIIQLCRKTEGVRQVDSQLTIAIP